MTQLRWSVHIERSGDCNWQGYGGIEFLLFLTCVQQFSSNRPEYNSCSGLGIPFVYISICYIYAPNDVLHAIGFPIVDKRCK